jgi:hypothetical protein
VAHLFREGGRIIAVVSDPMGLGWNIFGTAKLEITSWLTMATTFRVQVLLIYIGLAFAIYISYRVRMNTYKIKTESWKSIIPMAAFLNAFSIFGI